MKSLVDYKLWEEIKPYAYCEPCTTQPKKSGDKRYRRKLDLKSMPTALQNKALLFRMNCCTCGKKISPFRAGAYGVDISITCKLEDNVACSRKRIAGTKKTYATREVLKIEASINNRELPIDPNQLDLFGM